jgi:hydrogenase expression/formation protein HypC
VSGACASDHCVTCSDEAVAVRVVELVEDGLALCVDDDGAKSEVMVDLVSPVALGERLLIHGGAALGRVEVGR